MNADNSACIFEHGGFTYVCNFRDMVFWIMHEDDTEEPISYLELHRLRANHWAYRAAGSESLFQNDNDIDLVRKLEEHYEQYINQFIVGRNRSDTDLGSSASKVKKDRVHKTVKRKRH